MRRIVPPLVAAIVAVALGGWWLQRANEMRRAERARRPLAEGRVEARGLESPLRILRDARGVPHVQAASEADAYFGLGFAHAQDRLGEMLALWLSARGRTAELLGVEGLAADRLARIVGFGRLADRQARRLDAPVHRLLRAYAAGVNARLERVRAGLATPPAQFAADALPLEAWSPADSIAVLKVWSWGLGSSLETSLVLDDLLRALGPEQARAFFPAGAGVAPVPGERPSMVDRGGPHGSPRLGGSGPHRSPRLARGLGAARFRDPLRRQLGLQASGVGSSAWVIAGAESASGHPLLAGDTHLEATVPGLLYEAHLHGGGLDVAGATIPGIPVFWSGASDRVAWAATAARASVMDLFVESLDSGKPGRFHDGSRWRRLEVREERIAVKDAPEERLEVRETSHGPLINPTLEVEHEPLALAWAGARSGDGIGPMMRAARAADGAAFVAALARHHEPALAFVWADADGAGGLQVAGWIPRRALPSGLVPVSGRSAWAEWHDPVPADRLPAQRLGPGRPFVVAADGPLESGPGRRVEWLWRTGERSRRIAARLEQLTAEHGASLHDMTDLQGDVASGGADAVLRPALALAGSPAQLAAEEREVRALLAGWDRRAGADSVGAAVYHVFLNELARALLEPVLGTALYERWVGLVLASPTSIVADILAGAAAGGELPAPWVRGRVIEAVRGALRTTWLRFGVEVGPNREKWTWGRLHEIAFRPFGLLHWAEPGEPALGPHPYGGDPLTVAAGGYDWNAPFAVQTASTHRMAVDTGELGALLVSAAPGQVEQPGHPNRVDGVAPWLAGRPALLVKGAVLLEQQAAARLEIVPEAE